MAAYKLLIKPSAAKELEAVPRKDRQRIINRILGLSEEPRPQGCQELSGEQKYRIRQGQYRVVYLIDDGARAVVIFKVGHRREVYR
ncbi:MAG: type II toxin-antitoxin system RelE/ParE family toxin [Acidobacteriota bacterium]